MLAILCLYEIISLDITDDFHWPSLSMENRETDINYFVNIDVSHIRDYELIRLEGEEEIETIRFIFENDRRIVSNLIKQNTLKNTNLRQSLKIKITCCNSELIIVKLLETWYNLI